MDETTERPDRIEPVGCSEPPGDQIFEPPLQAALRARPSEALRLLHKVGGTPDDRVVLHVGFGHSATTSLQTNFFNHRDDLFYVGTPYANAGGFFSRLKYHDDCRLAVEELARLCREYVYAAPERQGRPIVVSDETFTECPEVFYAPRLLPPDVVAIRLKRYFPNARIVFTIRSQFDYVASTYFNLKRNYAYLAGMPIPAFEEWWTGIHSQEVCWHLANLDYQPVVELYASLFGRENLLLLPLEELKEAGGTARYLERLCRFMGIPSLPCDVARFGHPRNTRMSAVEERVAELIAARHAEPLVRQALENAALADLIRQAAPAKLQFSDEVAAQIRERAAPGNRRLSQQFHLPLQSMGYPT